MRLRGMLVATAICGALLEAVATVPVAAGEPSTGTSGNIVERLQSIPHLTIVRERPAERGFRVFDLTFEQPSDHRDPRSVRFPQRMTLLHRGFERPTVAYTSGYMIPEKPKRVEPTRLLNGNQISIESRFFKSSRPRPTNWADLNIWQAATDEHRIIAALKRIYSRNWITTGASKGGMTAVYHRRFYPDDVDGTVAYVAPNDVDNERDRYDEFLRNVGSDPACRAALTEVQREALRRRSDMLTRLRAFADSRGLTFHRIVGGIERGLETTIADGPWTFWQYRGQDDCPAVPPPSASTSDIFAFFQQTVGFETYTDQGVEPYVPYYYQAGTQLGWAKISRVPLGNLLHHKDVGHPKSLVPREIPMTFQSGAMRDVDRWVRNSGDRILFVNGENDPWTAEPFRPGPGSRDTHVYEVPGGNHSADIASLPAEQRDRATHAMRRWAEVAGDARTGSVTTKRIPGFDWAPLRERRPRFRW